MYKKTIIAIALIFILSIAFIGKPTSSEIKTDIATSTVKVASTTKKDIYLYTVEVAFKYKLDENKFGKVIYCESSFNEKAHNADDPYGGSSGVAQFLSPTFNTYKVLAGLPNGNLWKYKDAIDVMGYMWSQGQQSQWSFYRILYGDLGKRYPNAKVNCEKEWINFVDKVKKNDTI